MATKKIKVKYILNPGDGKDVEVFMGEIATKKTIATNVIREVMSKYDTAHKADPCAMLFRVMYAGRRLIFEQFYPDWDRFETLEEEERAHIQNKVLEHLR